jgi:hypothetical protein
MRTGPSSSSRRRQRSEHLEAVLADAPCRNRAKSLAFLASGRRVLRRNGNSDALRSSRGGRGGRGRPAAGQDQPKGPRASEGLGGGAKERALGGGHETSALQVKQGPEWHCSRQHDRRNDRGGDPVSRRRGKGLSMDPKVSALERAFQLAESGQVATVDDIKKRLKLEGYDERVLNGGPVLISQLRNRINAARSRPRPGLK